VAEDDLALAVLRRYGARVHVHDIPDPDAPGPVGFWGAHGAADAPAPDWAPDWDAVGRTAFLAALEAVETLADMTIERTRGRCSFCDDSTDLGRVYALEGWTWTGALHHHVGAHRVRPPFAFVRFVDAAVADRRLQPAGVPETPVAPDADIARAERRRWVLGGRPDEPWRGPAF
jgi:hypothetical protein